MDVEVFRIRRVCDEIRVETGGQPVVITKMFGPTSTCDVRVELSLREGIYIVYREKIAELDDGSDDFEWVEVCRFDAD